MTAEAIAATRLRALAEHIDRLEDQKRETAEAIARVYATAKGEGYDVQALRAAIRARRVAKAEREQMDELRATYLEALEGSA